MTSWESSRRDRDQYGSYYYPDQGDQRHEQTREWRQDDSRDRERDERAEWRAAQRRTGNRVVAARIASTIIQVICYLFAVVLAVHIILVLGNANQSNGFFQFVEGWSGGISLGFRDLFVPDNEGMRTLLNEGLAALVWIIIGILLSTLVRRVVLPVASRTRW